MYCWKGHLVLDPEPDRGGQGAARDVLASLALRLDVLQWIAHPDAHSDQPLQLGVEARELGGPAGQDDLADPKRSGLFLVITERGDEVARERLQLGLHRR